MIIGLTLQQTEKVKLISMGYFLLGVSIGCIIGWGTKVPFLRDWYKAIKETKEYKDRRSEAYLKEIECLKNIYRNQEL